MSALGEEEQRFQATVAALDGELTSIDSYLSPFFSTPMEELHKKLAPFEIAKLSIIMAYSINTLFYVYLKTQGISPSSHPVKQELERVKLYIKKLKELAEKQKAPDMKLNVEAANRFIAHALSAPVSTYNKEKSNPLELEATAVGTESIEKEDNHHAKKKESPKRKSPTLSEENINNSTQSQSTLSHKQAKEQSSKKKRK